MSFLLNYLPGYSSYDYYYLDQKSLQKVMENPSSDQTLKEQIIELARKVQKYQSETDVGKSICNDLTNSGDHFVAVAKKGDCLAFLYLSEKDKQKMINAKGTCTKVEINNVVINEDRCNAKDLFVLAIGYALKKLVLGGKDYEVEYKLRKIPGDEKYKLVVKCLKKFGFTLSDTYTSNLLLPFPQVSDIEVWTLGSPFNIWSDLLFNRYISWPNEILVW